MPMTWLFYGVIDCVSCRQTMEKIALGSMALDDVLGEKRAKVLPVPSRALALTYANICGFLSRR